MKHFLLVAALLSLALASGCATGGSGPGTPPSVTINDNSLVIAGLNLSIPLTVTVKGASQTAVNWTITGTSCTGSGNPCGTLTNVTTSSATYVAPAAVPSTATITIQATLQDNPAGVGSLELTIQPDTAAVSPSSLSIGIGLEQQFSAVALPDNAPQAFTWTCQAGAPCANFTPAANGAGTALYVPVASEKCGNNCVQISAAATVDPTGCSVDPKDCVIAKATVVTSRLTGNSSSSVPFSFRFSGFDNSGKQVFVAGTFNALNGSITSGIEDEITWNGSQYTTAQHSITGGSYTPITASDPNSNNAGTLTLTLPGGVYPNQYQSVLDGAGDFQVIESDGHGTGSGVVELSNKSQFSQGSNQTFAFGFTGVDYLDNRIGYAGVMAFNGTATVTSGLLDVNDNGSSTNSVCSAPPCAVTGTYAQDGTFGSLYHLTINSPIVSHYDLFVANGTTNSSNPVVLYAIPTDPVDLTHPAILGTMMLQDSTKTYNNAAFNGISISVLTGANGNVSLTLGSTDGSADASGNGNFTGGFDQNNNGTMVSVSYSPGFAFKYSASSSATGRYAFQMLGNPTPLPFILYASGSNRGFLLDQSSSAVITGTMNPQSNKAENSFAPSAMTGTFAVAPYSNSLSTITPLTMNLMLTSPGNSVFNVAGEQNPGTQPVTGKYSVPFTGTGTMSLTAPATADYIFYAVDFTHFYMIIDASKDKVASQILYAAQ